MGYVAERAKALMAFSGKALEKACKDEVRALKALHTLATAKLYLSKIRNEFREKAPDHPALKYLVLSTSDYRTLNANKEIRNYRDITNLKPIVPVEVISRARQIVASRNAVDIALGLMLLSGRRGVEVIRQGMFFGMDEAAQTEWQNRVGYRLNSPEQHVWFVGQAKIRGDAERLLVGYPIPLLCPVPEFLTDLQRLRETGLWQGGDFNIQTAALFRDGIRRNFSEYGFSKSSELRAAYAEIAYALYAPEKRGAKSISYEAYFSHVLGHRQGRIVNGVLVRDIRTAQSYRDFTLVWDAAEKSEDVKV